MSVSQGGSGPPPAGPWAVTAPVAGARDVVTGEAVALELRLARLPSRALALAVDLVAIAVILAVLLVPLGAATASVDPNLAATLALVCIVGVVFGYPTIWETLSRGRSPGKMLLGLRVVRDDGGPIRFRHAFVRSLLGLVDFMLGFGTVAVIVSLCSAKGKRVGDLLAGTVVVRERVPAAQSAAMPMPPQLAGWAAGLQVGMLPDGLALEVRQLLGRLHQLDPAVAGQLAARLSAEVSQVLGTAPPPGVDPYTHLHAVLAERRNRELARSGPPPGWPGPQPPQGYPPPPYAPQPAVPPQQPWAQQGYAPQPHPQQPHPQQPHPQQPYAQQPWSAQPPAQPAPPPAPVPPPPRAAEPPPAGPFAPPS